MVVKRLKYILPAIFLSFSLLLAAQTAPTKEQIREQMARIRENTNWEDSVAAAQAVEAIEQLVSQLRGDEPPVMPPQRKIKDAMVTTGLSDSALKAQTSVIADRYFTRSYKALNLVDRHQFDEDLRIAAEEEFSESAVRRLASSGGILTTLGNDHNLACVYLTAAIRISPDDTLSINNFGAYLRVIDSVPVSLPVLLYAETLYDSSPIILTQIGCTLFEMGDEIQAEKYLKNAVKHAPDFGPAHTALCEIYLQQNRLEDAIGELFAGVKGMGISYAKASSSFNYLQQQAEEGQGSERLSSDGAFWDEAIKNLTPEELLTPLTDDDQRLKMPDFSLCLKFEDWTGGGGYQGAVERYTKYGNLRTSFMKEFRQVHEMTPDLPENAVLRDFPNERFAIDCITEYFLFKAEKETEIHQEAIDKIMQMALEDTEIYLHKLEGFAKELGACLEGCGSNQYCAKECHRKFCQSECPATKEFNQRLQASFDGLGKEIKRTINSQEELLDDLYGFTEPWLSKIGSPYWSTIYAYEIQRVAMTIIGNAYLAYAQPFLPHAVSDCGTDCSLFANPYPMPPDDLEMKTPKGNSCPEDMKATVGILMCSISVDCESFELGCSAGAAVSVKRNFKNKSTTAFIGVGAEAGAGIARAEASAGFTLTRHDSGDLDAGMKAELTGSAGGPVSVGKNLEISATVMEGLRVETKNVIGF
jgi:tetratricopeptide (TPR) repeat protein